MPRHTILLMVQTISERAFINHKCPSSTHTKPALSTSIITDQCCHTAPRSPISAELQHHRTDRIDITIIFMVQETQPIQKASYTVLRHSDQQQSARLQFIPSKTSDRMNPLTGNLRTSTPRSVHCLYSITHIQQLYINRWKQPIPTGPYHHLTSDRNT